MKHALVLALLLLAAPAAPADPPPEIGRGMLSGMLIGRGTLSGMLIGRGTLSGMLIGRGTLIARDTGYYPKPPAFGGVWVSVPSVLTVVGREPSYMPITGYNPRPLLVCVDGHENVYLLDPAKVRPADVVKLVRGPLPEVNPARPIRYEPPRRRR